MNPCVGHSCDRCRLCRGGVCCLGRRRSREAELHARVRVTAWRQGLVPEQVDDGADALVSRVDAVPAEARPTAEDCAIATRHA
jgi:hypothetical protein